ncbi:MAG: nucleotidyltransferase domain-containing protein [Anaerolineae bacterium]
MRMMTENEQAALDAFAKQLQARYPRSLARITLFGSKARGDSDPESDIDVLVVLNNNSPYVRQEIRRLAARISLDYDVLLSVRALDRDAWEPFARYKFPLYQEVETDGIDLMERPATA